MFPSVNEVVYTNYQAPIIQLRPYLDPVAELATKLRGGSFSPSFLFFLLPPLLLPKKWRGGSIVCGVGKGGGGVAGAPYTHRWIQTSEKL